MAKFLYVLAAALVALTAAIGVDAQIFVSVRPAPPIANNLRTADLGNSKDAHPNEQNYHPWANWFSGSKMYYYATGNQSIAGDNYHDGELRVAILMAACPQRIVLMDPTNDFKTGDGPLSWAALQSLLATIQAHPNYATCVQQVWVPTGTPFFTTSANYAAIEAARLYINAKIIGGFFGDPKIVGMDNQSVGGYGTTADGLHYNANGAYLDGQYIGAAIKATLTAVDAYPPTVAPKQVTPTGVAPSGGLVQITATAHGLTPGTPCHLNVGTISGTIGATLNNSNRIVYDVPDANNFRLLGTAGTTGTFTGSSAISCGFFGNTGGLSDGWTLTNTSGATVTTTKEVIGGRTYQAFTISTVPTDESVGISIQSTLNTLSDPNSIPGGFLADGWIRMRLTNAANNGPPVGLQYVQYTASQTASTGVYVPWTITLSNLTLSSPGNTYSIEFFNSNTNPGSPPPATEIPCGSASVYRFACVTHTNGTTNVTTEAAAIAADINALAVNGLTATSAAGVITLTQPTSMRSGTFVNAFTTCTVSCSGVTPSVNAPPLAQLVDDMIVRTIPTVRPSSTKTLAYSFSVGVLNTTDGVDVKVWLADPLFLVPEQTAYAIPASQTYYHSLGASFVAPTATLATSVGTTNAGNFSGGGLTYTQQWYSAPNPVTVTMSFLAPATVSGAAAGAGGVVRLAVNTTAGMTTGDTVFVEGVRGTVEAYGTRTITVIDGTHVDLPGTTFVNAWVTSAGTVTDQSVFTTVTKAAHGYSSGQPLSFTATTMPLGVPLLSTTSNQTDVVYVCGTITANAFNICTTPGGARIYTSTAGSGTITAYNWTVVAGATDNPHDFTADSLSGQFVNAQVTATNGLGSGYQFSTKSAGTLPHHEFDEIAAANDNEVWFTTARAANDRW